MGPGAVVFDDNELQPDVAVLPVDPARASDKWVDLPRAILVVEVLSCTTRKRDLVEKRAAYQRLHIPNYWVVDRFERRVLVWEPASERPAKVTETLQWQPRPGIDPLVIAVADILPPP